ncbi:MAG: tetratricopeptide repeat protein [Planctomycetota bacterium]
MKRSLTLLSFVACLAFAGCSGDESATPVPRANKFAEVEALARERKWGDIVDRLEQLRAAGDLESGTMRRLAEAYVLKGEPAKAIARLREAIAANPDDEKLYTMLAQHYLRLEESKQARELLETALARGLNESPDFELAYGSCLGFMDDLDGAAAAFDRAKAKGADSAAVEYNHAVLLMGKKRYQEARNIFEALLEKDPTSAKVQRELARALLVMSVEEPAAVNRALDLCIAAREKLPDDWRVYETIGDAWLALGDFDASIQAYTEALRLGRNPLSVEDRYREAKKQQKAAQARAVAQPDAQAGK